MSKLRDYFEAWLKVRREDVTVRVKVSIEWFDLAIAIVFVLWAYKELVR